jgi:hypothetical protein
MMVETDRSMLKAKGLSGWFWGEAMNTIVYVLNRCPMKSIDDMTLFEAWHERKPVVHHLRTSGCIMYVRNTMPHLKKLEDHGRKMIFVSYESGSKAYCAYDPIMKRVHVTRDMVYVEQPTGFIVTRKEHKVLKLKKALYELHQAPRAWNAKLDDTLLSLGFQRTPSEHSIYVRRNDNVQLVVGALVFGVYIDDLIITGSDCDNIRSFKEEMVAAFKISDLSLLHYYLSIEVKQSASGISLSQGAYAMKILERSGMTGCNPCHVPMEVHLKLSK